MNRQSSTSSQDQPTGKLQQREPSKHEVSKATFVREFFGLQLELLHQKLDDPQALPAATDEPAHDTASDTAHDAAKVDLTPQRLHQLFRHWTMFAQPMVQFEKLPAEPGQASWDRLLALGMQACERHAGRTPKDQRDFAQALMAPLTDWLCDGWEAYERNQAMLPWRGCFRSEVDEQGVASLHFYNAACPYSPFDDLAQRTAELQEIISELREQKHAHTVRMASWLNNLPAVQSLFPASYVKSLTPVGIYPNGLGWWGQIITRQGAVHPAKAQQIRQNKGFAHVRLAGACPLEDWPA